MNGRYRFVPDPDLMLCLHDAELCAHQASAIEPIIYYHRTHAEKCWQANTQAVDQSWNCENSLLGVLKCYSPIWLAPLTCCHCTTSDTKKACGELFWS